MTVLWIGTTVLAAFFAGITSILAKIGIRNTDSDLATALRTIVVLVFAWIMVGVVGSVGTITEISGKSLLFLVLSGLATGASWICYFKALAAGDVNKVAPIDKSSTVLTVLLAIICFGETYHLAAKLIGTVLLGVGVLWMVERKDAERSATDRTWLPYAVGSAVFAALTAILAKVGITGVESNLGTAIRTAVVLVMAWVVVWIKGKQKQLRAIDLRELLFIGLSGLATGASWLCYYHAIQNGVVSVVVPIDKMSIVVTIVFSYLVFRERLSRKALLGLALMVAGTLTMAIFL
jgi:transporter family protein